MTATTTTTAPPMTTTVATEPARRIRLADLAERLFWTFLAAFTSALVSPPLAQAAGVDLTLSALEAAVLAGGSAAVNFATVVARWRLDILPDPGAALRSQ